MNNWNHLKKSINPDNNLYKFQRKDEIEQNYKRFRMKITNIFEYLNNELFQDGKKLVFKKNDFPYDFDDNIIHYLVWINPSIKHLPNKTQLKTFIEKEFQNLDRNICDYICFKNNIINKSVETIEHYHVLIKIN